jgi:carbamoylphosphate synthase large subunit
VARRREAGKKMSESVGRNGGGTGMGEGLGGGHRVLVLGPGPLSPETGTAPAYASWKTARLLSEEGFEVVGMDPSDTSLLTLPGCCSRFYPEPLAAESVEAVLEKESPGFLAGYSTGAGGMFLCARLFRSGALKRNGCEMLGPSLQAIHRTQDRALFKEVLMDADLYIPRFVSVLSLQDGIKAMHRVGFPLVVRPHYSSGGRGSARACNLEEYLEKLMTALRQSPMREVTVEEDLSGWREFICVAARDRHGEKAFLGAIEQLEPAGANGGDSMWVFPAASLGKELSYFLEEACGKIADVLDIRGVLEVEVLIHPRLEEVCVSEAHPGPGQSALFMCFAAGCDTAGLDLLLSLGYGLDDSLGRVRGEKLGAAVRIPYRGQGTGTAGVPLDMERSSVGEWVVGGGSMQEAARRARRLLEGGEKTRQAAAPEGGESLMMMPPDAKLAAFWREGREPDRLARRLLPEWFERFLEHGRTEAPAAPLLLRPSGPEAPRREGKAGVLLLGGEPHHPARGADGDINAVQALLALRDLGREPLAYGENPLLARLAISLGMEAALGPLDPDSIIACARETGSDGVFTQYGGEASLALTRELTDRGCAVPGLSTEMLSFRGSYLREQRLFIEGAPLIVAEEEVDSLERALEWAEEVGYPHVAYTRAARGSARTSIVYGPDDLRSFYIEKVEPQGGRLTMRPLYEDGVVVLAELLALPERVVLLGLAQNLEDAGAAADDCMLSAPPLTLTREQSERVGSSRGRRRGNSDCWAT